MQADDNDQHPNKHTQETNPPNSSDSMLSSPSQPSPYGKFALEAHAQLTKQLEAQQKLDAATVTKREDYIAELQKRNEALRKQLNTVKDVHSRLLIRYAQHKEQVEHVVMQRLPEIGEEVTVKARTDPGYNRPQMLACFAGIKGNFWVVHSVVERKTFQVESHEIVFNNIGAKAVDIAVGSIRDIVRNADLLVKEENAELVRSRHPEAADRMLTMAQLAANAGKLLRAMLVACKGDMEQFMAYTQVESLLSQSEDEDVLALFHCLGLERDVEQLLQARNTRRKLRALASTKAGGEAKRVDLALKDAAVGKRSSRPAPDEAVDALRKHFEKEYKRVKALGVEKSSNEFKLFFAEVALYNSEQKHVLSSQQLARYFTPWGVKKKMICDWLASGIPIKLPQLTRATQNIFTRILSSRAITGDGIDREEVVNFIRFLEGKESRLLSRSECNRLFREYKQLVKDNKEVQHMKEMKGKPSNLAKLAARNPHNALTFGSQLRDWGLGEGHVTEDGEVAIPADKVLAMDETAVITHKDKPPTVVCMGSDIARNLKQASDDHRTTACITVDADGTLYPTFFIMKGQKGTAPVKEVLKANQQRWHGMLHPTASMYKSTGAGDTLVHGSTWEYGNHLIQACGRDTNDPDLLEEYRAKGNRYLLIIDGALCHLDDILFDMLDRHGIDYLFLPKNTTSWLAINDRPQVNGKIKQTMHRTIKFLCGERRGPVTRKELLQALHAGVTSINMFDIIGAVKGVGFEYILVGGERCINLSRKAVENLVKYHESKYASSFMFRQGATRRYPLRSATEHLQMRTALKDIQEYAKREHGLDLPLNQEQAKILCTYATPGMTKGEWKNKMAPVTERSMEEAAKSWDRKTHTKIIRKRRLKKAAKAKKAAFTTAVKEMANTVSAKASEADRAAIVQQIFEKHGSSEATMKEIKKALLKGWCAVHAPQRLKEAQEIRKTAKVTGDIRKPDLVKIITEQLGGASVALDPTEQGASGTTVTASAGTSAPSTPAPPSAARGRRRRGAKRTCSRSPSPSSNSTGKRSKPSTPRNSDSSPDAWLASADALRHPRDCCAGCGEYLPPEADHSCDICKHRVHACGIAHQHTPRCAYYRANDELDDDVFKGLNEVCRHCYELNMDSVYGASAD